MYLQNWRDQTFLKSSFFSDRERAFVLASAPKTKAAVNLEYGVNKLTFGARATYFGEVTFIRIW
jgi:iron complex outermembrane receptor protein